MDDKACAVLSEVDNLFTRGIVNEKKFNNFKKFHSYCPRQHNSKENKCTNDYERINALGSYLFTKINEIDIAYKEKKGVSHHIELFMIWIGSKLFKMDNDYKATLEESYKKHLESIMGNVNYWEIISNKLYMNATIRKMDELYSLLDNICKLITEYNKKPTNPNRKALGNHAVQCRNFYKTIHKSINGCRPYLHLLDSVKMMYENFRWNQIVNNNNLTGNNKKLLLNSIQPLTTFNDENKLFVPVAANLSFGDKECLEAKSKDEQIGKSIASQKPKNITRGTQTPRVPGNAQRGNTGYTKIPAKPAPPHPPVLKPPERPPAKPPVQKSTQQTPQKSEADHQSGAKGPDSKKGNKGDRSKVSGGAISRPENSEGKPKDAGQKKPNQVGTSSPGPKVESQPTELRNQGSGADGQLVKGSQGGSSSGIGGGRGSVQGDQGGQGKSSDKTSSGTGAQGGSDNQIKHSGDSPHGNPATAPSGAGITPPSVQLPSAPQSPTLSLESQQQPQQQPADSLPKDSLPKDSSPKDSLPTVPPTVPPTGSPPVVQQPDSSLQTPDPQKPDPPPQPPAADPAPSAQDGKSSQTSQTGGSSNQNEQKDSSNSKEGTGGTKDNKGDPNDGSKGPGDGSSDSASSTSGGSFDWGSSIFEFILKGKEYYDKASEFIKDNQQKFKDAAEKISSTYNDTVENLKNVYNVSSSHFNNIINNIASQLNKNDTPSKLSDKNPVPGNPVDGGSPSNQLPSNSQPNLPPTPALNPQPPSLQLPSPPIPTPSPTPDPPKGLIQQKQTSLQPQPITQQPVHVPVQANQPNHKAISQLVKSPIFNLNLKKPWNIFPTTWNGSGDCKPEIKFINTTLVCCTSEQCSFTGILITLVLIPIILSIAYKYLPFGSSKKSEKKNMKRVINFHDGNRKTKIIISSYDRNKDLKPVINLVGGKKNSLLNIYKIIQADPMPFINLFFLLIFFVYKRKRDTIE